MVFLNNSKGLRDTLKQLTEEWNVEYHEFDLIYKAFLIRISGKDPTYNMKVDLGYDSSSSRELAKNVIDEALKENEWYTSEFDPNFDLP